MAIRHDQLAPGSIHLYDSHHNTTGTCQWKKQVFPLPPSTVRFVTFQPVSQNTSSQVSLLLKLLSHPRRPTEVPFPRVTCFCSSEELREKRALQDALALEETGLHMQRAGQRGALPPCSMPPSLSSQAFGSTM